MLGVWALWHAALSAAAVTGVAQTDADTHFANFAFASEVGSGVYQIGRGDHPGLHVQAPAWRLRYADVPGKRPGLRLIFP